MEIKSAKFVTSVANVKNLIQDDKMEIAFAGKSNVGKSSFINMLVGQKKLAKTSSLPGRTRLLNYFLINNDLYFVDLPGYGYAQAGQKNKEMWAELLEEYLIKSNKISLVLMLVDLRHDPTQLDKIMLKFLYSRGLPFKIIATKADKIAKTKIPLYVQNLAKCLGVGKDDIIAVSNETGLGKTQVLSQIEQTKQIFEEKKLGDLATSLDAKILVNLLTDEHFEALRRIENNQEIEQELAIQLVDLGLVQIDEKYLLTDKGENVLNLIN